LWALLVDILVEKIGNRKKRIHDGLTIVIIVFILAVPGRERRWLYGLSFPMHGILLFRGNNKKRKLSKAPPFPHYAFV